MKPHIFSMDFFSLNGAKFPIYPCISAQLVPLRRDACPIKPAPCLYPVTLRDIPLPADIETFQRLNSPLLADLSKTHPLFLLTYLSDNPWFQFTKIIYPLFSLTTDFDSLFPVKKISNALPIFLPCWLCHFPAKTSYTPATQSVLTRIPALPTLLPAEIPSVTSWFPLPTQIWPTSPTQKFSPLGHWYRVST